MTLLRSLVIAATLAIGHGFSHQPAVQTLSTPPQSSRTSRREVLFHTASISLLTITTSVLLPNTIDLANAIPACPKGSQNCVRQTWTSPSSLSPSDTIAQLRETLAAYPQEGQEDGKVDGGGYTIISDTLNSSGSSSSSGGGSIVLEYKSSGKGFFAKGFNGGKPFVDDLIVESSGNGTFEFRSSSRIGDSDFGVNSKRLSYIGGLLKGKGWSGVMLTN
jgi:hypothetical protein